VPQAESERIRGLLGSGLPFSSMPAGRVGSKEAEFTSVGPYLPVGEGQAARHEAHQAREPRSRFIRARFESGYA